MNLDQLTARYLPAVEAEMQDLLAPPADQRGDLYNCLRYHMGWVDEQFRPTSEPTGKRLRPVFCLLTCEACAGDWQDALPAAAAVELLHNFSLIHDDIEDGDVTRRGRPTMWTLWGVPQTLNAGDAMYALAQLALLRSVDRGLPAETVVTAAHLLNRTCLQLTEGQFLDIRFETQQAVAVDTYLQMVSGKTAALLAAACELGALAAAAPLDQRNHLCAFGHHLGLAFQIQDDLLGIWGDPQLTGKPVGADLQRHKKTLPIIHGLQHCPPLRRLLTSPQLSPDQIAQAIHLLETTGSDRWAGDAAAAQTQQALTALDDAHLCQPFASVLHDLALQLLQRVR